MNRLDPRLRRGLELAGVAVLLFGALLGVAALAVPDFSLSTLEAWSQLREAQRREQAQARRLGAELEAWRRERLDRVGAIRARLEQGSGFAGGIHGLATDASGRVLVAGDEETGLWLGVLRLDGKGRPDRHFLGHVSQAFAKDSVVGTVRSVLPLPDGRILLHGRFRKPETHRRRPRDPGEIGFALLGADGRPETQWHDALWAEWPRHPHPRSVQLDEKGVVWFAGGTEVWALRVGDRPRLARAFDTGARRPVEICPSSGGKLFALLDGELWLIGSDGDRIANLTPAPPEDAELPGVGTDPALHCAPGGRALAVLPLSRTVFGPASPPHPSPPVAPGELRRTSVETQFPYDFLCGNDPIFHARTVHAGSLLVWLEDGRSLEAVRSSEPIEADAAAYSAARNRWLLYAPDLPGGSHRRLIEVSVAPLQVDSGAALGLEAVRALAELPDGRLVLALEGSPGRLRELHASSELPGPFGGGRR